MQRRYDGFWFPASVRDELITPDRAFDLLHFKDGTLVPDCDDDTVSVRWPRLDLADWQRALGILQTKRKQMQGKSWHERLPRAMGQMRNLGANSETSLWYSALEALETCTGHSAGMLRVALSLLELISVEDLQQAASFQPSNAAKGAFVSMDGLPGRVRFFVRGPAQNLATQALLRFEGYRRHSMRAVRQSTDLMLGYAAGNVPGTGLLLVLLGLAATTGTGNRPPVILIRNSRREPIFTSLVLSALELVDPGLLDTTLVTVWEHEDTALQEFLVSQADLVVAAASDETIDDLASISKRVATGTHRIRFHGHGHKVSFSTIGRESLEIGRQLPGTETALMEAVACLASLDVALWNQQGCLSSRVHFVEESNKPGDYSAEDYGRAVVNCLRDLDQVMPKAVTRKRQIHNLFDQYQAVAVSNPLQVLSGYDDDFLVLLDRREMTGEQFKELVNTCQGRTVAIVPVSNVMEVASLYLHHVGSEHLQSMSVALGNLDTGGIDPRLLAYAEALGSAGVTSVRTVGRGGFPQLAYSWDGLLPLDMLVTRQPGHYTTLEFDEPWQQISETYALVSQALSAGTREP